MIRFQLKLILFVVSIASVVYAESGIPAIGTAVRFQTEELKPGWHRGFFNQLRTVPPCYLVMTFTPRASQDEPLRVSNTVPVSRIHRLQMVLSPAVSMQAWDGLDFPEITDQSWQEVDIESLLPEEGRCNYDNWSAIRN